MKGFVVMSKLAYFSNIRTIVETKNFCVFAPLEPHIDRDDGGHICIGCKLRDVFVLQDLEDEQLFELSLLSKITGEAILAVSAQQGIAVKLINYQINGNWTYDSPNRANLHMHLYGRSSMAKKQVFGQSLLFPDKREHPQFYSDNKPLTEEDISLLRWRILRIIKERYKGKITTL